MSLFAVAGIHLAGWVIALGSRLSLSHDARQYLFGSRISTNTSDRLIAFELFALFACGLALLILLLVLVLAMIIGRANRRTRAQAQSEEDQL